MLMGHPNSRPHRAESVARTTTMMTRYYEWTRRAFGPPALGAQVDLWRLVPEHPAAEWVRSRLKSLGHSATDGDVAFWLSRSLIKDVLHAAGAAEYTANRVLAAIGAVEDFVDTELRPTWPDRDLASLRLAHPLVDYAYIEWSSLLEKLKALMDRVQGQEPDAGTSGLIPSLKPDHDPRRPIEAAFSRLTTALDRDRSLATYSRHLHAFVATPAATARLQWGRVILPLPIVPPGPVVIFDQFTSAEGRDVVTFTRDGMAAVEAFVNDMLAAFEAV
jgi:hypothetical protein